MLNHLLDEPRLAALELEADRCLKHPGDFVEAGVYRGGSASVLCKVIGDNEKALYLFDTWNGMTKPGEQDMLHTCHEGQFMMAMSVAQKTLEPFKCRKVFVQGDIRGTVVNLPDKVAFAHIDLDLYEPTLITLAMLAPKLTGSVIVDDYSPRWRGVVVAVDRAVKDGVYTVDRLIKGIYDDAIVLKVKKKK